MSLILFGENLSSSNPILCNSLALAHIDLVMSCNFEKPETCCWNKFWICPNFKKICYSVLKKINCFLAGCVLKTITTNESNFWVGVTESLFGQIKIRFHFICDRSIQCNLLWFHLTCGFHPWYQLTKYGGKFFKYKYSQFSFDFVG